MSYRAGVSVSLAMMLGKPELAGYPRVVCDACGDVCEVPSPPPMRFLNSKGGWPRGWKTTFHETEDGLRARHDLCANCRKKPVR